MDKSKIRKINRKYFNDDVLTPETKQRIFDEYGDSLYEKYLRNKRAQRLKKRLKLIGNYSAGVLLTVSIGIGTVFGFNSITNFYDDKRAEKTYEFVSDLTDENDGIFYDELESLSQEVKNIEGYIQVVEELHDLDLEKIESYNYSVDFIEPEKLLTLIEKYKESKSNISSSIGNEVVELNELVYVLNQQEKMYNQKLYESYDILEDYALHIAKALISEKYDINEPKSMSLSIHNESLDSVVTVYCNRMEYNVKNEDIKNITNLVNQAVTTNKIKSEDDIDPTTYSKNRIKKITNAYDNINEYASKSIVDVIKENEKGNQK